ncbi:Elicitin-like protein 6 precursor, partial [Globisporangium splendens]
MKLQAPLAVAAAIMVDITNGAPIELCNGIQRLAINRVANLLTSMSTVCFLNSGFNLLLGQSLPSDAQRIWMCGAPSCHLMVAKMNASNLPDCRATNFNVNTNLYAFASTFESEWTRLTASPTPTTTAPPIATPAPTMSAPSNTPPTPATTNPPTVHPPPETPAPLTSPTVVPTPSTATPTTGEPPPSTTTPTTDTSTPSTENPTTDAPTPAVDTQATGAPTPTVGTPLTEKPVF